MAMIIELLEDHAYVGPKLKFKGWSRGMHQYSFASNIQLLDGVDVIGEVSAFYQTLKDSSQFEELRL